MSANVTWFGDVADGHDAQVRQTEHILDQWVERGSFSVPRMAVASGVIAFMRFGQSFTDLLRLGNGVASGGAKGVLNDGLRLISISGVAGAAVGRLSRVLVVRQAAGTMTCSWITTTNALRRTGQRFFTSLEELAKTAGVSLPAISRYGSGPNELTALVGALRRLAVPVRQVAPSGTDLGQVERLAQANRGGVLVFALRYVGNQGKDAYHQLYATFGSTGLMVVDTSGHVFRGLGALRNVYRNADLVGVPGQAFFVIPNAGIITAAHGANTAGGFSSLVLELVSLVHKRPAAAPVATH